jgi:hypothetical protein
METLDRAQNEESAARSAADEAAKEVQDLERRLA